MNKYLLIGLLMSFFSLQINAIEDCGLGSSQSDDCAPKAAPKPKPVIPKPQPEKKNPVKKKVQPQTEEVEEEEEEEEEIKSKDFTYWQNDGDNKLYTEKRYEEAIVSYDKALAIKPNSYSVWDDRAIAFARLKRYEEAVASYDKVLAIKPDDYRVWHKRGIALRGLKRYEEAVANYDKILSVKPNYYGVWVDRGLALYKQGKLKEAQGSFARALEIEPHDLRSLSNDIELALVQKDTSRMLQRIKVALPLLKPNDHEFAILPFLLWLAHPNESPQPVLDVIYELKVNTESPWDFSDIKPVIEQLPLKQQRIARYFIDFFEGRITLLEELTQKIRD